MFRRWRMLGSRAQDIQDVRRCPSYNGRQRTAGLVLTGLALTGLVLTRKSPHKRRWSAGLVLYPR